MYEDGRFCEDSKNGLLIKLTACAEYSAGRSVVDLR